MSSITILAYIIVSLSIGYAFAYPLFGDISSLGAEKNRYENSLAMVENIENKKNELLTKFNNIPADSKKDIETILPDSLNFIGLISQIDAVAAKYGLSIDKTSSKETSSSVGGSIGEAQPQRPYQSAIISFSFTGSYDQFNTFMGELERSLRILDIRSLKIEPKEDGAYSYRVEFETYWLKSS